MIARPLADKLFEAFLVQRWNDRIRPVPMVEMDKAAHKMIVAFLIGRHEDLTSSSIDWPALIDAGIFEVMKKIALSDIKAPIHRMIEQRSKSARNALHQEVVRQWQPVLQQNPGFLQRFQHYMLEETHGDQQWYRVLRAAHKFSTLREFRLLSRSNADDRSLRVELELAGDLEPFAEMSGLVELGRNGNLARFLEYCEQLRFQQRWSQTQRLPATSVLGHSMLVAMLSVLLLPEDWRAVIPGLFFASVFHDLPESLTRDIVSPVKGVSPEVSELLKAIESELLEAELLPLLPNHLQQDIRFFSQDEFSDRALPICGSSGTPVDFSTKAILADTSMYRWIVPGRLLQVADYLAAFLEAHASISSGVRTKHLYDGWHKVKDTLGKADAKGTPFSINVGAFLDEYPTPS